MGKLRDLTGLKFGRLTVLHMLEERKHGGAVWHCRCDCGNEVDVRADGLVTGHTKSCGCYHRDRVTTAGRERAKSLVGMKFGRLTVVAQASNKNGRKQWHCLCDCGGEVDIPTAHLNNGHTKSCGCLAREKAARRGRLQVGALNGRWKGGSRNKRHCYPEYYDWRKAVYERDDFTCQKCGKRGGKIHAHHIEDYATNPRLRIDMNNGITFCDECHRNFHHRYGIHSTRKQVEEFLVAERAVMSDGK